MNNIFEKLGFRKMDEMERSITLRAQAYGFRFVAIVLFLWSMWESWVVRPNGFPIDQKPCLLLLCACAVQLVISLWLRRRAVAGDDEYQAPSLLRLILPVLFWVALIAMVGAGLLVTGA